MGSTIAMRREILAEIGGYAAFAEVLADDYEIGRAIRARGHRIVLPDMAVAHGCSEISLRELYAHELRWAVTVRIIDPVGHAGSVVTHTIPLALIGAALSPDTGFALIVLAAAFASRLWLKHRVDSAVGRSSGPWTWLIGRDLLSFGVFLGSLFARAVYWRGARFGVSSGRKVFPA
jgi:ceramide glucosyltransferase